MRRELMFICLLSPKLEILKQEYDKKCDKLKDKVRNSIIEHYRGEGHLEASPKSLLLSD